MLKNERLHVSFTDPKEEYTGTRFDHMGMIKRVILDNKDTFYSKESLIENQGSGGEGFYNEFGIEEPIGFDETAVGQSFLKIGIGALTKDSEKAYDFFYNYPVQHFDVVTTQTNDSITFHSQHFNINDYAVDYKKTISLHDNKLIITYTLKNTGTKIIETTEYCHNFVAINDKPIGPDYELNFSYPLHLSTKLGTFEVSDQTLYFSHPLQEVLYCKLEDLPKEEGHFFEVRHKPSGVGFKETSHFPLERVAVWGMPHVISPEAFVKISIQPGETQTWQRVYTFFN